MYRIHRHRGSTDIWASPPLDILLEVFRRLDTTTDLVRCAAACKPWRRAIIGNASCLQLRPDHFNPNLLLGFFHDLLKPGVWLQPTAGPPPPSEPAVAADLGLYDTPVSCRDGLLLLLKRSSSSGGEAEVVDGLCLYNAMTGDHTFLPAATEFEADSYVLVTGYDLMISTSGGGDADVGARVVAVKAEYNDDLSVAAIHYQQFSLTSGSGSWGPVKRSPVCRSSNISTNILPGKEVVCGGAIHWLGMWTTLDMLDYCVRTDFTADEVQGYVLAVGRTLATKLPDRFRNSLCKLVLASTADGRLSVVRDCRDFRGEGDYIQVWVLIGDDEWVMERMVAVPAIPAYDRSLQRWQDGMVFCPRSGCVLLQVNGGDVVIELHTGSSSRRIRYQNRIRGGGGIFCGRRYPYEMDWSTYLSRMKHF